MRSNLPNPAYFLGKEPPGQSGYIVVELVGSGNNAHVFRAHSDRANNDIACKVIPKANLAAKDQSKPAWREEIDKANALRSPLVVKFWNVEDWVDEDGGIDCIVLYSEYVRGKNLMRHLKGQKNSISVTFCELFLKDMFSLIYDMENHDINHGDLHSKNIIVEDRSDQLGGPEYAFRVTDFGVASATSDRSFKDDYEQVAIMLRSLLVKVDYQFLSPRDKYAFNTLNDNFLARHLTERDLTRDGVARRPKKLYERLEEIDHDFAKIQQETTRVQLSTPFDFLSCEQIGESHTLLRALYSDAFLGLPTIENKNNLVLTGPRGCGKSTVFKSLSLRHRILAPDASLSAITYIGIYYRCDDLYSVYPRYRLPDREDALNIPMHYLTATLIIETLESVEMWARNHFLTEFSNKERSVSDQIWEAIRLSKPQEPASGTFKAICFRLQKERRRAADKQYFVHDPKQRIGYYFGPEILPKVCEILLANLSFVNQLPFYFFIDDYSLPKITKDLQRNLNRLLMQRSAYTFFKLATESPVSYVREDIDCKAYVEGREFILLNLGLVYIVAQKADEKLQFIEDVFARRFRAVANYPVATLHELIGSRPLPRQTDVALAMRNNEKPDMWGKETLCELCSGDIFYILSLVGRMVSNAGDKGGLLETEEKPKVKKELQKKAIREEAANFLNNLRGIPHGEHLVGVVTSFGNVAHSFLKFRNSKNEKGNPPHLASRIEPYEELNLSESAQEVYQELLRYSLFLEDPRGKSRRGKIVPRLYLRRALLPHFNLTFSYRDSIELEASEIEELLLHPQRFEDEHRLRKEEVDIKPTSLPLFDEEDNG